MNTTNPTRIGTWLAWRQVEIISLLFFQAKISTKHTKSRVGLSSFHDELKAVYINHLVKPDEDQDDLTASDIMLGLEDQSQIISEAVRPSYSSSGWTRWLI